MRRIGRWLEKKIRKGAHLARRAWPGVRALWDRFGYGASVVLLLLLVGTAAYAYRSRPAAPAQPAPTPTPEPAVLSSLALPQEAEPAAPTFLPPVFGEVVGAYAPDALVWSDTMLQWQVHMGVDVAAPLGTAVAAADGTVEEAYRDYLLGNVVALSHEGGYRTVYASLQSAKMVEVGQQVKQGDVIGAVGNSADAESALGAHLHFEMLLDAEHMEPLIAWEGAAES